MSKRKIIGFIFLGILAIAIGIGVVLKFKYGYGKISVYQSRFDIEAEPDTVGRWIKSGLEPENIKDVSFGSDNATGKSYIQIILDQTGRDIVKRVTSENTGKRVALTIDGYPFSMPVISEPIDSDVLDISGGVSYKYSEYLTFKARLLGYYYKYPFLQIPTLPEVKPDSPACGLQDFTSSGESMTDYGFSEDSNRLTVNTCKWCEKGDSCAFLCLSDKCNGGHSDIEQGKLGYNKILKERRDNCYWFEGNEDVRTSTDSRAWGWLCGNEVLIRGVSIPMIETQ